MTADAQVERSNRRSYGVWCLRRDLKDYVTPVEDDQVVIWVNGAGIACDRPTARLLAKRINQCLDATTRGRRRRTA